MPKVKPDSSDIEIIKSGTKVLKGDAVDIVITIDDDGNESREYVNNAAYKNTK